MKIHNLIIYCYTHAHFRNDKNNNTHALIEEKKNEVKTRHLF